MVTGEEAQNAIKMFLKLFLKLDFKGLTITEMMYTHEKYTRGDYIMTRQLMLHHTPINEEAFRDVRRFTKAL